MAPTTAPGTGLRSCAVLFTAGVLSLAACTSGGSAESESSSGPSDSGSGPSEAAGSLTGTLQVYAAASLKGAFDVVSEEFAAEHPELTVKPTVYDGSSTLVTQIIEGAPVDVFASADERNMATLTDEGMDAETPQIFATNKITIAVPAGNPDGIAELADLLNPNLVVILCADEVPCGGAARNVLEAADVVVDPVSNEQNVTAVATKVASREADAGLVYVTDVQTSGGALQSVEVPLDEELINRYPIAVVRDAPNPEAAQAFVDFMMSVRGQAVLKEFGFGSP